MYISGRPYEQRYVSLKNVDRNNISDLDLHILELLIKKNFLSAYITSQLNIQEYRDMPKMTMSSYLSQFGAAANFWAGVTVIVVVEIIEVIYELISGKCKSKKTDMEWWTLVMYYTKKGCYTPGWCVFFVIISISSVREV